MRIKNNLKSISICEDQDSCTTEKEEDICFEKNILGDSLEKQDFSVEQDCSEIPFEKKFLFIKFILCDDQGVKEAFVW